jgi:hypothetical protein
MATQTTRRLFLGASGGLLGAAGAIGLTSATAAQRQRSKQELIRLHVTALRDLVRDELPASATRMDITISSETQDRAEAFVSARALKKEWEVHDGLRRGGLWVERSLGEWRPKYGLLVWSQG